MTNTRKILTICLVVAAIATVVSVISAILKPDIVFTVSAAGPGVITVVLCIALLSSKKDNAK